MQSKECIYICDQFTDYQENTINAETKARVETHLTVCTECQRKFTALDSLVSQLHQLPKISTSPDFNERLLKSLQESADATVWTRFLRSNYTRAAGYAVAAGLVVALGLNFLLSPVGVDVPGSSPKFAQEPAIQVENNDMAIQGDSTQSGALDSLNLDNRRIQSTQQSMQLVNSSK